MIDHNPVGVAALSGGAVLTPVTVIVGEHAALAVLIITQLAQVTGPARPDEAPENQQHRVARRAAAA